MNHYKKLYLNELKNKRISEGIFYFMGGFIIFTIISSWLIQNAIIYLTFGIIGGIIGGFYKWILLNQEIEDVLKSD